MGIYGKYGDYIDMICPYNGREFTYPQDALSGISGIFNAMCSSFPSGFIHGLPRLFLDYALLWQPFERATRRIDRTKDKDSVSSFPSWSWCGWQVFVDPWSFRSGLANVYSDTYQARASTWRTRKLVDWHIAIGNQEPILLDEPGLLDKCLNVASDGDIEIPAGWTRRNFLEKKGKEIHETTVFVHEKDEGTLFEHPLPITNVSPEPNLVNSPAYLSCQTTIANFLPATVLKQSGERKIKDCSEGAPKVSVFDDKRFERGPVDGNACSVLVLQQANGAFAGLLRLMTNSHISDTSSIELAAISSGSATASATARSMEWRAFERGEVMHRDGRVNRYLIYDQEWPNEKGENAFLFDIQMAFDEEYATRDRRLGTIFDATITAIKQEYSSSTWFKARTSFLRTKVHFRSAAGLDPYESNGTLVGLWRQHFSDRVVWEYQDDRDDPLCEFYNVLWIERKDGIAYRKACGWVPKRIWEAHAVGPLPIKLG